MYILSWSQAYLQGTAVSGGKGWNLARLHRYGFNVPPGGVVAADAYRALLRHPDLAETLARASSADPMTADGLERLARMRAAVEAAPLPAAVAGPLHAFLTEHDLLHRPVAVRSSATAEDSAGASFAGIHRSFLNLTGLQAVTAAIKGCYASLWTPQALAYRRKMGLPDEFVAAAVVIMAMVPAHAAGVAFSCDPRNGRLDRVVISAALGLGEAVVSGNVEPDELTVDITGYPPAVIARKIGNKSVMYVPKDDGGLAPVTVAAADRLRPALTEPHISELTMLTVRIADALGELAHPQDLEWAHDGDQFWVLQARPVTNLPAPAFPATAGQPVYWSNANLKDVMPGVQSALGWSFTRASMEMLLAAPLKAAGYPYPGGMTWIRLFEGRAYFNLSAIQWAFYDCMNSSPAETSRIMGGHQPEIHVPRATPRDRFRRGLHRLRMIRSAMKVMSEAEDDFRRHWAWSEAAEAADLAQVAKGDLLARTLEVKTLMEEFLPRFQIINGAAGGTLQELIKLVEPVLGDRAVGLVNAMLAGASQVTSAQQGERLVRLGNAALSEERTRAYFADQDWRPREWAERLADTAFHRDFVAYLQEYGHRGVYEIEPMHPRWREDPTYLLETVRAQVLSGREIHLASPAERRESASREVFRALGLTPRALQARFYLNQVVRSSALREMAKSVVVKVAGVSRLQALEMGRRLVAHGLLDEVDDVFHLTWIDLEAWLLDRPGAAGGFRLLAADRKALRAEQLRREPPDVIIGETPVKLAPPPAADGPVLKGMGVASGQATGRVRIVRHPEEGSRLQPGEVLVAPSTDPAWTPLFLRASAIVMEVGGYLSHGAIVAREYGLPAVVNVPGLLQALQDGETVTVDGDAGQVRRQS